MLVILTILKAICTQKKIADNSGLLYIQSYRHGGATTVRFVENGQLSQKHCDEAVKNKDFGAKSKSTHDLRVPDIAIWLTCNSSFEKSWNYGDPRLA
ncbi:PREDICTED: uncharacterized protein LOC108375319 isoform X2 [Rhagoletis zephyria]|uniref:uncharacterized protein LOC108375319 isoform X2 n=1 Tax=Rhagoletis zephyria TaxID=28612 RepID=UPI00081175A2|nr:PREDICTED: uncharacterized protein LOC108375319 isoform X2 [Rhagoletis zephyria]